MEVKCKYICFGAADLCVVSLPQVPLVATAADGTKLTDLISDCSGSYRSKMRIYFLLLDIYWECKWKTYLERQTLALFDSRPLFSSRPVFRSFLLSSRIHTPSYTPTHSQISGLSG